jgi:hypothetical protein
MDVDIRLSMDRRARHSYTGISRITSLAFLSLRMPKDRVAHFAAGCPLGEFYFAHEPGP